MPAFSREPDVNFPRPCLIIFLVSAADPARCADVSAVVHMNRLLTGKAPVERFDLETYFSENTSVLDALTDDKGKVPDRRRGYKLVPAKVKNSFVVEAQALTFDEAKLASLPELVLFTKKTLQNCADASLSSNVTLNLVGARSWSVQKQTGVTITKNASVSGTLNVPGVGSTGMLMGWSRSIATSTSRTEGSQESVSRSMSDTVTLGPKKAVSVSLQAFQSTIEIPCRAMVVVDGDLVPNDSGIKRASELLSVTERTLPISGVLRVTDVSDATVRTEDLVGASGCEGTNDGLIIEDSRQEVFPSAVQ
jgi:hypothetical protein